MTTTQTIAGHRLTLTAGRRYLATRPMARKGMKSFDVTVQDITDGISANGSVFTAPAVATVGGLGYDAANDLLAAFNDPECSFAGRVW